MQALALGPLWMIASLLCACVNSVLMWTTNGEQYGAWAFRCEAHVPPRAFEPLRCGNLPPWTRAAGSPGPQGTPRLLGGLNSARRGGDLALPEVDIGEEAEDAGPGDDGEVGRRQGHPLQSGL